jgi:FAS-associated factor 2
LNQELHQRYGANMPSMQPHGYGRVLEESVRTERLVLVYLHSRFHSNAEIFSRDVLFTDSFASFVNNNFVFWAADINKPEGFRLNMLLNCSTYPFLAVVAYVPPAAGSTAAPGSGRMLVLDTIEGRPALNAGNLIDRLTAVRLNHLQHVGGEIQQQQEAQQRRRLREEQEAEYFRSLREDEERERRAREEAEAVRREEELAAEREREEAAQRARAEKEAEELLRAAQARREEKRSRLGVEPDEKEKDTTYIAVRFPDGRKLGRRYRHGDTLQMLLDWVDVQEDHADNWRLVTTHPRKEFGQDSSVFGNTIKEVFPDAGKNLLLNFEPL